MTVICVRRVVGRGKVTYCCVGEEEVETKVKEGPGGRGKKEESLPDNSMTLGY